jgi:hypothetical protein
MFKYKPATVASISVLIIASAALMGLGLIITNPAINANAQTPSMLPQQSNADKQDTVTIQKTEVSSLDPCIPATCSYVQKGNSGHQLVMALPPRTDGKVWVGVVTWSSSKPVEVLVFQGYNSSITPDAAHGQPLTAPFGNGQMAISLIKTSSGTPIASGSYPFAGNGIAFHTLGGDKFTITYTISVTARELSSSIPSS